MGYACLDSIIRSGLVSVSRVYTLQPKLVAHISDYKDPTPLCKEHNIKIEYIKNINTKIEEIRKIKPDIIFVIGWSQIIKKEFIECAPLGCIGFHPALLPKNRGRAVIAWHFINEEKYGGCTFFYIDEGCDSGDIILQKKFSIRRNDNARSYYDNILRIAPKLLKDNLLKILQGKIRRVRQDNKNATYLLIRNERDSFLDFRSMNTKQIFNQIRSVAYLYPTAFFAYEGENFFIYKSRLVPKRLCIYSATIGQIIKASNSMMWVKTTDGIIEFQEIYDQNSRKINCASYFRVGHCLN